MPQFNIRRGSKVDHCLMFDWKATRTVSPRERIAMFQTAQPDPSRCGGDGTRLPNCAVFKPSNITTRELMNLRLAQTRRVIQETLVRRRNAVCSEIERTWFAQGSHLEKHRHNLQATHKLKTHGLMTL